MEAAVVQDRVRRGCAGSGGRSLARCGGAGGGRGGPRKRETWELESRAGKENGTGEVVDETRAGGVGEPEQLHVRAASSLLCPDLPSPAQEQLRPHKAVTKIRKRHLLWVSKLGKWSSSSENRPHRMRRRGSFPSAFTGQHGPTNLAGWLAGSGLDGRPASHLVWCLQAVQTARSHGVSSPPRTGWEGSLTRRSLEP